MRLWQGPQEFVNEAADVGDVGGVTHFAASSASDRCTVGESVCVDSAEKVARFSQRPGDSGSVVERVGQMEENLRFSGCWARSMLESDELR